MRSRIVVVLRCCSAHDHNGLLLLLLLRMKNCTSDGWTACRTLECDRLRLRRTKFKCKPRAHLPLCALSPAHLLNVVVARRPFSNFSRTINSNLCNPLCNRLFSSSISLNIDSLILIWYSSQQEPF